MCITMENNSHSVRKKQYWVSIIQTIHTTYSSKYPIKQSLYFLYPQSTPLYKN